jgi:hypothetical protein
MGIIYHQIPLPKLHLLRTLIKNHEANLLGPRARGYWIDYPDMFDYEQTQEVAQTLDQTARESSTTQLELSELQAHALTLLELEMPHDGAELPPQLFLVSGGKEIITGHLEIVRGLFAGNPANVAKMLRATTRDRRFQAYFDKMMNLLRETLPQVWQFWESAEKAGMAIVVIDLRARDVFIPSPEELAENMADRF